ncbi:MAG: DUF1080 domain-containing protein [Gammaproteobacteria bacterium]|nr:DUF1080 domain-containing protein [Gammaproteobacteria bacterium]
MIKKLATVGGLLVLVLIAWRLLGVTEAPTFVPEEGYTALYDGRSLAGWQVVGGGATFSAQGESIVGRVGPGENTFLRTQATFGDFSLKLQMRWDEPGNSGVMFRANQRGGDGRTYGYQYELDASDRAWSGGIYDEARRGWLANLENNAAAREAIRLDDWNDVEIQARGASLQTWINGVPAADIVDGLDARGFIALQVHSGSTGVMRWRHIQIKELPPTLVAGDSLVSAAEWRDVPAGISFDNSAIRGPSLARDELLVSRRLFNDAMIRMTVPACEQPTIVQLRHRLDSSTDEAGFAEVRIFSDRAQARLVTRAGERLMDPIQLPAGTTHEFVGLTREGEVALTIGEQDALRISGAALHDRGQLRVHPARCGQDFVIDDLAWYSLKRTSAEPLFYQTLEVPPAPVLTPEQALQSFHLAPGFEIELVAAEPLVEDPVAMAWDEYGRLYVVEMRGYMPDAYGTGSQEPVGQVVRLEDTDGDGRMDTSEVFLGQLVNPRAVAVVNEGILIGEPPNLWLCELPAHDALCTSKRRVGGYATNVDTANVEHMENGLLPGLDNWLYNAKSDRRLRLVDGAIVAQQGVNRGQWGITKDNLGRLLYNHNSTWVQADLFQAEDIVLPDRKTPARGVGVNLTPQPEVFSVRVNPGVNRAYLDGTLREDGRLNRTTGVSGLVAYRGDQFPARYAGDVFVPESAGNVVAQFAVQPSGMSLQAQQRLYPDTTWGQRDFLGSTDERFRPVDASNGPDGALYIIDMYRGIIQDDHFLTDELREQIFQRGLDAPVGMGRIWRVRHSEGAERSAAPVLATASDAQLVAALSHGNGWVRDTAQRLLLARGDAVTGPLAAVARTGEQLAALHALWTLHGRHELDAGLVQSLLGRTDEPQLQVNALRAGATLLSDEALLALEPLTRTQESVAMQWAFALSGRAQNPQVRAALVRLLEGHWDSPFVNQAVVRAVYGHETAFLQDVLRSGVADTRGKPRVALLRELGSNAYLTLRGDLTATAAANPQLTGLLELIQSRAGALAWQQVALLQGLNRVADSAGFVPAALDAAPPIFADATIGEDNPLYKARLAGRRAFTWPGDELALGITPLSPEQLKLQQQGEAFYVQCAACHGDDGKGISGLAPALAGASWVTGPPEWLGRIILQGLKGPIEVNGEVFDGVMPGHGHLPALDDATLAGLMTYLRRSWGNRANPVSVAAAAQIRQSSADRQSPWTASELQAVAYDRGYARFVGQYKISFVTFTVTQEPDGLHMSVPMYGAGKLEPLSDTRFGAVAGGEKVEVEFVVEDDGSVDTMILLRQGERIPVPRKG